MVGVNAFWHSLGCCLFIHAVFSTPIPLRTGRSTQWPSSYASLGDSYAAGAGAGSPVVFSCGRFSGAYPVKVAGGKQLNISHENVRYLACGGSNGQSVLFHQVPFIGNSDVVTITAGGNEIHFFNVLNACVYHWLPFADCEKEIGEARAMVQSRNLINQIDTVIARSAKCMHPDALLLVTGYARFFNERTDLCDHVTFSRTRPLDYLTKEKRRALNQLVSMLNDVIRASAELHGVEYIDIDPVFEGHRFCEDGVREPDIGREATWFFNLPAAKFQGEEQQDELRSASIIAPKVNNLQHLVKFGQLQWAISDGEDTESRHTLSFPDLETVRTFHPTEIGHQAIADVIVKAILKSKLVLPSD
ncbi:hypothetical protein LTR84_010374 [Exophiala bonariae]|uniref:SGNH hydrolase-type esterase domain-containing protein n=1 Tax=Exophiala bonariae TaxID=1690606 RepID=A0AAV9MVV9_9EURO|nr:hypothetical protein LTR84_010374 [Exophiala bonariae]